MTLRGIHLLIHENTLETRLCHHITHVPQLQFSDLNELGNIVAFSTNKVGIVCAFHKYI